MRRLTMFFVSACLLGIFVIGEMVEAQVKMGSDLEKDIKSVSLQINEAEKESAQYSGGLVKSLIILRLQILKNTKAMLEQKKYALKHGIPIKYTYKGKIYKPIPVDQSIIQDIESDIRNQEMDLSKAEAENAKYSGGLVKAMILSQIATIKNTIAMLEQRKLTAKYGIPLFALPKEQPEEAKEEKKPTDTAPAISKAKIEVVDWSNRLSDTGNYIYVEGILKNVGDGIASLVRVKVKSLDEEGKLVSIDDTYADPSTVTPGQEATFQVMVRNDSRIKKFKLSVLWR